MKETAQERRERYLKQVQNFRLLDDDFMREVFNEYSEGTQLVLNILLERTDLRVIKVVGQREVKNPVGRGARLDIHAVDANGKNYDIEIQRADKGAGYRRARYNSSLMDTTMLQPSEGFEALNDSYVIFITESDVIGASLPIYHIDRTIKELEHASFDDGSHILYVNGAYEGKDSELGWLMHDFRCRDAEDMHFDVLAERVKYFKETQGGQESMCKFVEDERNMAAKEATQEARIASALTMLENGLPKEQVALFAHLSIEEVEALMKKQGA